MIVTEFPPLNGKRVALRKHNSTNTKKYRDIIGNIMLIMDYTGELYVFLTECDGKITRITRDKYKYYEVLRIIEE